MDIALDLGFSSHEHFTRTFKDTFGMTPEEYRNNPQTLSRMTKPELLLHYTLVDEGVPLMTEGIVLEINRRQLAQPLRFVGLEKKMPVQFVEGLGTKSGVDPLDTLWREFHRQKRSEPALNNDAEELGVSHPCADEGYFFYFAGAKTEDTSTPTGFTSVVHLAFAGGLRAQGDGERAKTAEQPDVLLQGEGDGDFLVELDAASFRPRYLWRQPGLLGENCRPAAGFTAHPAEDFSLTAQLVGVGIQLVLGDEHRQHLYRQGDHQQGAED